MDLANGIELHFAAFGIEEVCGSVDGACVAAAVALGAGRSTLAAEVGVTRGAFGTVGAAGLPHPASARLRTTNTVIGQMLLFIDTILWIGVI